jgi:hypothetical protein
MQEHDTMDEAKTHAFHEIDKLIENEEVPKEDKLLLGMLSATYQFAGQSKDLDLMAALSLTHLEKKYPDIFKAASQDLDTLRQAEAAKKAGGVH